MLVSLLFGSAALALLWYLQLAPMFVARRERGHAATTGRDLPSDVPRPGGGGTNAD
ncbi:hypothetical protein [Actinoallomurus soli]|uniref:hypothetical protein n=1 Tax=Actinoallomurus soli TaxID=2952535 RepID=UPI0020929FCA|nr:hypothetical protein [Actinoallomurus soli]MCO5972553.1 hypothetical protein [Actinoallomurus soli]